MLFFGNRAQERLSKLSMTLLSATQWRFIMSRKLLGLALGMVLASGVAFAQKAAAPAAGGDGVTYKAKTTYDFDDDVVEGDLVRPDGEFVDSRKAAKHSSLIKIRDHFIPEMLKSAEDI
jgi:hypothetical protein